MEHKLPLQQERLAGVKDAAALLGSLVAFGDITVRRSGRVMHMELKQGSCFLARPSVI